MRRLPSIRQRLSHALLAWSLLFSLAIATAVWLAARHEADELLDDSLEATAQLMQALLEPLDTPATLPEGLARLDRGESAPRFAWQLLAGDGRVLLHSNGAPHSPWPHLSGHGFADVPGWRVLATPLGEDGRMLYVAQTRDERVEAEMAVTLSTVLAALAVALLGFVWLRSAVSYELAPLQALSQRLAGHDPMQPGASLGPAARAELQPMQEAIEALGQRLARRLSSERAFSAHAAHALRTPLAGIDVQLAVALREAPPALQPRLLRVREAAQRLQRVVVALLTLFRRGDEDAQLQTLDLATLFARLPVDGLQVEVAPGATLHADPDLLSAALLNLLDNALRHGARSVSVSTPRPQTLRLHDDGAGVAPERRAALLQGLRQRATEHSATGATPGLESEAPGGLGLLLADLVARTHGGALDLPEVVQGFAVELQLGAAA